MSCDAIKFNAKTLLKSCEKFSKVIEKCETKNEEKFQKIIEMMKRLKNLTREILSFASIYDFSDLSRGNGFWSFVHVSLAALEFTEKKVETVKGENFR
jgi:hypothetical protein